MIKVNNKLNEKNSCVVIVDYDEVCDLLSEIDVLIDLKNDNSCKFDFATIMALKKILYRHYLAVEKVDYDD